MRQKALAIVIITFMLCFIFLSAIFSVCWAEDSWTLKAPMTEGRSGLGVVALNGNIYAIGGAGPYGFCNYNEKYSITTGVWVSMALMPTSRSAFAIANVQNKIYCIGGYALSNDKGLAVNVNEVYDPTTDSWSTKAPMPTPELNIRGNVVGDKIYVIGGNNNGTLNQVYDPLTDSWTAKAPIPNPVSSYASAVADQKIYIFTSNLTQIYDPTNNSWSYGTPAPLPLILANAAVTSGENAPEMMYVFSADAQLPYWQIFTKGFIIQSYNPKNDSWQQCGPMQNGRYDVGVVSVDDLLYLIGGYTTQPNSSADPNPTYTFSTVNEQYNPSGYPKASLQTDAPSVPVPSPSASLTATAAAPESGFTTTPTPTVPELTWLIIVPLLLSVFAVALVLRRRKILVISR